MSEPRPWENVSTLHFEFPIPNREQRFKQLVLYIADRCVDDPTFSKIKLLKTLFFSDFDSYGMYGAPITGVPYKKMPFGPVPVDFPRIQAEMQREKLIKIHSQTVFEHNRQRVLPLEKPNLDLLQARDIAVVDGWITRFWNETSKRISDFSHAGAWRLAKEGARIPYEAVFISTESVTADDVDRVKQLIEKFGWQT